VHGENQINVLDFDRVYVEIVNGMISGSGRRLRLLDIKKKDICGERLQI